MAKICERCRGTGYASAAHDSGKEHLPPLLQPLGVYKCTTCDGTGQLLDIEELLAQASLFAKRRERICKQSTKCPKCRSNQVQIINSDPLAKWKCRHCHHTWRYEPLVIQSN